MASCAVIVAAANDLTRVVHDRMPVLLAEPDLEPWLPGGAETELLRPAPSEALRMWLVSRWVNRSGQDDDPSLIEPLSTAAPDADT